MLLAVSHLQLYDMLSTKMSLTVGGWGVVIHVSGVHFSPGHSCTSCLSSPCGLRELAEHHQQHPAPEGMELRCSSCHPWGSSCAGGSTRSYLCNQSLQPVSILPPASLALLTAASLMHTCKLLRVCILLLPTAAQLPCESCTFT